MGDVTEPLRGTSAAAFREVTCKDCLRELATGHRPIPGEDREEGEPPLQFEYSEDWAQRMLARGGNRTDRCLRHRKLHRQTIQGLAVPYVDLQTIGEVADRENPTGPLGGLGKLPATHVEKANEIDLAEREFGMTDDDVRRMLELLSERRVLILKAGTGTGKSTFGPFRLMSPPADAALRLTDFGPIVVTEPRVQATIGVATFVGEKLVAGCGIAGCAEHIGPGYPVGYQVKGDRKHDDSCQLVYVTDGTMVSWLGQGRLNKIGTVIIDEAHERSTNIDFILGYLNRELDRYPHLRVIVTSATFNVDYFVDYFGGEERAASMDVPAVKTFGYGSPLFPQNGEVPSCHCEDGAHEPLDAFETWLTTHWPNQFGPPIDGRPPEDLWDTTRRIHALRAAEAVPGEPSRWRDEMAGAMARQVIKLVQGLDAEGIHGDILAFLPSEKLIKEAIEIIGEAIPADQADVYALLASMSVEKKEEALARRGPEDPRRVLVASNIAETSLTIEGIRFVVDSGLITQEVWDADAASRAVPTVPHSRSGIRQRWGRVGRDAPGWVFPLYTREQLDSLAEDTAPGSTRANLEQLIMTAKSGGIDDVESFPWPAAHPYEEEKLDRSAREAIEGFDKERKRASAALLVSGSVDADGDATDLGKEMQRFSTENSTDFALATVFADQLACVPELVTAMCLLEGTQLAGATNLKSPKLLREDPDAPAEWRLQAAACHAALFTGCRDDLDFVIRVMAAWERADSDVPPWVPSALRRDWCDRWWIDDACLVKVAEKRRATLEALSPAMREEVKRFLDARLAPRARAILSAVMVASQFLREGDGYRSVQENADDDLVAELHPAVRLPLAPERLIALKRESRGGRILLQNLVAVEEWACEPAADGGPPGVFELLLRCAQHCSPRSLAEEADPLAAYLSSWPVGGRFRCRLETTGEETRVSDVLEVVPPFSYPRDPGEPLAEPSPLDDGDRRWPGNRHPEEDEEALATQMVLDPSDDEHDRERGLEVNDYPDTTDLVSTAEAFDVLDAWEAAAVDCSRPAVVLGSREGNPYWSSDEWFEVGGYEFGEGGQVVVVLEPALLPPEVGGDPSRHDDLAPGAEIEVAVGRAIGQVESRELWRLDGRGRFLVGARRRRGAQLNDLPVSLNDDNGDLLGRLSTGAVLCVEVVLSAGGRRSITLVPLFAGQLEEAADDKGFLPALVDTALKSQAAGEGGKWGEVTLQVAEPGNELLHSFGVNPRLRGIADKPFEVGDAVRLRLGLRRQRDRAALPHRGREDELAELVYRHADLLSFGPAGGAEGAMRLTYLWSVSPELRDELLRLDADDSGWQEAVWAFYVRSHEKIVQAIAPGDETEPITAPLRRPQAGPPVQLSGTIPTGWEYMFELRGSFARQREALAAVCGATIHSTPPRGIRLIWSGKAEAEQGLVALRGLFAQPVAAIAVPSEARGALIGSGGENLKRLAALDGVFDCSLLEEPSELRVVASDSLAIRAVIDGVAVSLGMRMTVPDPRLNGKLIGPKGAIVRELCEASGCSRAQVEKGTVNWTVRAKTRQSIEEFVRLANERVPGCQLGPAAVPVVVRDEILQETIDDWATHEFAPADVPLGWVDEPSRV